MQCPIGRAPHTMVFANPVMVHRGKRPMKPRQHRDSTPQPADCKARKLPMGGVAVRPFLQVGW